MYINFLFTTQTFHFNNTLMDENCINVYRASIMHNSYYI